MQSGVRLVAASAMVAAASLVIRADVTTLSQASEIQLQLGDLLYSEGRYGDALDAYRHALRVARADATNRPRVGLISSALRVAAFDLARREAETLNQTDPKSPDSMALYGDALWSAGLFQEAEAKYRDALAVTPALARGHHGMARSLAGSLRSHRDWRPARLDEQGPAGGNLRIGARQRGSDGATTQPGTRASWVLGLRGDAVFALSNAGVGLSGSSGGRVTVAVVLGLAVGKPLGITAAALAAVRLRQAVLPVGVSWTALHGCAWLGGIGFTMSLFIATLAFGGANLLDSAKVGILGGSALAGIVGTIVLRHETRAARQARADP